MKKVDKFFNKKFEDQEFEFKDAYWADAQKLIEADEKRRRKAGWLPWFFGFAFLGMIGFAVLWYLNDTPDAKNTDNQSALNIIGTEKSTTKTGQDFDENSNDDKNEKANTTANGNNNSTPKTINTTSKKKQLEITENKKSKTSSSSLKTNNTTKKSTTATSLSSDSNKTIFNTKGGEGITTESISTLANSSSFPNTAPIPSENTGTKTISSTKLEEEPNTEAINAASRILFSPFGPLASKNLDLIEASNWWEPKCNYRNLKEPPRWNFAWNLYSLLNTEKGTEYLWLGAATGPSVQYRLNKRFAIQSDLLYRWRRGHFGSSEERTTQKTYSFGFQEETFWLAPTSVHQLDLPIFLQLRNRRQSLEGGISFQFNMATMGDLISEKSLYPWLRGGGTATTEVSTVQQATRIKDPNIRKLQLGLLLGYRYQVNKKVMAVLQTRYELNSIYKMPPLEGNAKLDGSPLHIQIGLTYYPFK